MTAFWRRGAKASEPFEQLPNLVASSLSDWPRLTASEQAQLLTDVERLLRDKSWEAAKGFELRFAMRVAIAAQAALVTLAIGIEEYREVRAIVVHPTTLVVRTPRPGPVPGTFDDSPIELAGEAHGRRGPVSLAWDAVRRDLRIGTRIGQNVVIHEFVHKLDMLDGLLDGTPPLTDDRDLARWVAVSSSAYAAVRTGEPDPVLRDYAATDPAEFFAVAAEAFFTRPVAFAELKPDLYGIYRDYFRQDPAARWISGR